MKYRAFLLIICAFLTILILPTQEAPGKTYEKMQEILDTFERPFTLFEFEPTKPYSFTIAQKYNVVCVISSPDKISEPSFIYPLFLHCTSSKKSNVILLDKISTMSDLERLSECEHFDVVICQNIFSFLDINSARGIDFFCDLGEHLFLEILGNFSDKDFLEKISAFEANLLKFEPSITDFSEYPVFNKLYFIKKSKNILKRKTWVTPVETENTYLITSNYLEKKLTKKVKNPPNTFMESTWVPGINLITFKALNGIIPTNKDLQTAVKKLRMIKTNDFWPNNMIVQGKSLVHIDSDDPTHGPVTTNAPDNNVKHVINFLNLQTQEAIFNFYGLPTKNPYSSESLENINFEIIPAIPGYQPSGTNIAQAN